MYPNTNLQPGMSGPEVKKLQDFLVSKKLMTPEQVATGPGIYGPQTTAAVKKFQEQTGVDNTSGPGFWGPKTISAASGAGASNSNVSDLGIPLTAEEKKKALMENPLTSSYISYGNTVEQLQNAYETGDWSTMTDETGKPFSIQDQQTALNKAKEQDSAFYEQQKAKETSDAEATLASKQADYQDYLINAGEKFQSDKSTLDQNAADRGVLFSGGRKQKETALQTSYERDQATKLRNLGADVSSTAGGYQYAYGNDAAKGLSKYYTAGGNTYNPNVATGGVGSTGLSNIYNPSASNYAGTRIGEQMATANKKASGLLWNKGNKLLATGNQNKY
jgi:peptidoglycan hydrolase-like protein with peptidoglycan-binding domain